MQNLYPTPADTVTSTPFLGWASEARYFLLKFEKDEPLTCRRPDREIPHLVYAYPDADIYWFPQELYPTCRTNTKESVETIRCLVVDLDFDISGEIFEPEAILDTLDQSGIPPVSAIVSTGGGFHVYWDVGPIDLGPQVLTDTDKATQQKRSQLIELYEDTAGRVCTVLKDLGADSHCCDVAHLFRVPGSRNQKRMETARVVHLLNTATDLQTLSDAVAGIGAKSKTSLRETKEVVAPPRKSALTTAPAWWLWNNVMPEGNRHAALFVVVQMCLFSGRSEAETLAMSLKWAGEHTVPPLSHRDVEFTVRSCAKGHNAGKPLGIDHRMLATIKNTQGETMPIRMAQSIYSGLPELVRPNGPRRHRKKRLSFEQSLERCMQAIEDGRLDGLLTDEEAAKTAGVSISTFKKSIKPKLKDLHLCFVWREGVSGTYTFYPSSKLREMVEGIDRKASTTKTTLVVPPFSLQRMNEDRSLTGTVIDPRFLGQMFDVPIGGEDKALERVIRDTKWSLWGGRADPPPQESQDGILIVGGPSEAANPVEEPVGLPRKKNGIGGQDR